MHTHAVAVTHTWSGFSCTNLPGNRLYKQGTLAHTCRHMRARTHTHTHTHTSWPWLSVVSRSADTWKDTLERGPFHSNSARQHLARTQRFTPTVVKGMRVLNSTAAHSSPPAEWGKKSLSWTQHSTGCTLTHTPKALTHPSSTMECEISNLSERTSGNWRWVWNISDYVQMVHTQSSETMLPQQNERMKMASIHTQMGDRFKTKPKYKLSFLLGLKKPRQAARETESKL